MNTTENTENMKVMTIKVLRVNNETHIFYNGNSFQIPSEWSAFISIDTPDSKQNQSLKVFSGKEIKYYFVY